MLIARQRIYTCYHQEILISFCVCWIVTSFIVINKLAAMQLKWSQGVRISRFKRELNWN